MNKATSIYLDAVRFLAACAVFLDHVSSQQLSGGLLWQIGPYGPEAVDVFFVLSGFVIAYVVDTREKAPLSYTISRLARIYSVALPALIATFVLDAIGRRMDPILYTMAPHYVWHGRIQQFLHALFFLNEMWFKDIRPGTNTPWWSLGYEVWYYVIFAVALFAPRRWRGVSILILLVLVGPKIVALFPIWLYGVAAYRICTRSIIPPLRAALLCLGSMGLWIVYEMYCWQHGRPIVTWIGKPLIVQDYVIGTLFFLHLVGFRFISPILEPVLLIVERPIRWVAGATLSMYLFHFPISEFFAAVMPWPVNSWPTRVLVFLGTPTAVFLIAEVTERQKAAFRRTFEHSFRLLAPLVPPR